MALTPIKTPLVAKKMFPNYVWNLSSTEKTIYLTFDDGPTPEITDWTLITLKKFDAQATFFCIGDNIKKYPDIFKNIVNDGHVIGNHTQNHIKGWKAKTKDYLKNIEEAQNIIDEKIQESEVRSQNLFRPPYGQITPKQGRNLIALGYKIVMWDLLSFDWDKSTTEAKCLENVISKAKSGSVIVFHDSLKASKNMTYALPKVLEHFSNQNYNFKAITF